MGWPFVLDLAIVLTGLACAVVVVTHVVTKRAADLRNSRSISVLGFVLLALGVLELLSRFR